MKAITIHAPWAWAIATGHKRIENRSWRAKHRGQLAIVAGKSRESDAEADALFAQLGIETPEEFARGAIVAVVDLVDVHEYAAGGLFDVHDLHDDAFACGPFCFELANVRRLREPVPFRGNFSIFNLPADVVAQVETQLEPIK